MRFRAWGMQRPYFFLLFGIAFRCPCSVPLRRSAALQALSNIRLMSYVPAGARKGVAAADQSASDSQGLPELALDEALTRIAREQSFGMAQQGFISHNLPLGDLRSRMAKAGYLIEIARENVASAPSVDIAHSALSASPDHENNILANDVTRVGIGISHCPDPLSRQLYITEIFAAPREEYPPENVQDLLSRRIDDMRQNRRLVHDPRSRLEKMASHSLESISLPYMKEELRDVLSVSTRELENNERIGAGQSAGECSTRPQSQQNQHSQLCP